MPGQNTTGAGGAGAGAFDTSPGASGGGASGVGQLIVPVSGSHSYTVGAGGAGGSAGAGGYAGGAGGSGAVIIKEYCSPARTPMSRIPSPMPPTNNDDIPPPTSSRPSCTISAEPKALDLGESVVLRWGSQNASSATLAVPMTGENYPVPVSGTQTLSMRKEAVGKVKINLDVVNAAGHTAQCSTEINISTCFGPGVMPGDNDAHANVSCTICATPSSVKKGDPVTLKWSSLNALAAMLAIPATGENIPSPVNGSKTMTLNVTGTMAFNLHLGGAAGTTGMCTASANVSP